MVDYRLAVIDHATVSFLEHLDAWKSIFRHHMKVCASGCSEETLYELFQSWSKVLSEQPDFSLPNLQHQKDELSAFLLTWSLKLSPKGTRMGIPPETLLLKKARHFFGFGERFTTRKKDLV